MRDRRGLRRTVVALLIGTAVLTGCSEKQQANESLPTPSAAKTTPDLPPLGPADFPVPDEAREETPEGAVEFVRYYVALTQHLAVNSADPTPLANLSQDCRTCIRIAQSFEADLSAGYTYQEYAYEFDEYGPALIKDDAAEVGFTYVQGPITAVDPAGQVVGARSAATPEELRSGATLLWKDDMQSWLITSLTVG